MIVVLAVHLGLTTSNGVRKNNNIDPFSASSIETLDAILSMLLGAVIELITDKVISAAEQHGNHSLYLARRSQQKWRGVD